MLVVAADGEKAVIFTKAQGEDSRSGIGVGDRSFRDGPSDAQVARVENTSGRATGSEEDFIFLGKYQAGVAGSESSLAFEGLRHVAGRERFPVAPVRGVKEKEFAVHGIAEGEAIAFRDARDGIKKEFLAGIGELKSPGLAGVGGFVDARAMALAARHEVSDFLVDGDKAAEIKFFSARHMELLPGFSFVD